MFLISNVTVERQVCGQVKNTTVEINFKETMYLEHSQQSLS